MYAMTAAHRTLPFGTLLKVTNLHNGRETVVRVNNRGPYVRSRMIDLSKGAAQALGMVNRGVARVKLEVVGRQ
jgi:rare lipoprotein A